MRYALPLYFLIVASALAAGVYLIVHTAAEKIL